MKYDEPLDVAGITRSRVFFLDCAAVGYNFLGVKTSKPCIAVDGILATLSLYVY